MSPEMIWKVGLGVQVTGTGGKLVTAVQEGVVGLGNEKAGSGDQWYITSLLNCIHVSLTCPFLAS